MKHKISPAIYYFILIIYLEIILKYVICHQVFNIGLLFLVLNTIPIVILLTFLTKLFNKTVNSIIMSTFSLLITIYAETQFIFFTLFSVPLSFTSLNLANQAADFIDIILDAIRDNLLIFILILLPLLLFLIIVRRINLERHNKYNNISLIVMFIIAYLSTFGYILPNKELKTLYFNQDNYGDMISNFGVLTYTKVDIKRYFFGYKNVLVFEPSTPIEEQPTDPEEKPIQYNKMDLNFSNDGVNNQELINLNNYFAATQPTKKNEYTGMFKGKNLIFILAEGFNEIAVDEVRTPTLYKMVHQGFDFKNFYSPVFFSTTGGEFQATTGLIATQESLSLYKAKLPTISFGLGNAFANAGYRAQSFHDWTYTYYKRNKTMETLGFTNYIGCNNGLENRMSCAWLPKDSEMATVTTPDYLGQDGNFVTYYVTVSGHSPYAAGDNIARLHYDAVKDVPTDDATKYYLASQIELDKMLEELVNKLTESGELENTVIALVGDHYPYTLKPYEINSVSTYERDAVVEINHSNFILWNSEMEPIEITKVGSQIDVLPTLLNLFDIEYDSRLIVGHDILSDEPGLAIFSNRSWVSDEGTYFYNSRSFVPKEGRTLEDTNAYISRINNQINNYFSISKMIVNNNYYNYILNR